jgi:hypothetical protein
MISVFVKERSIPLVPFAVLRHHMFHKIGLEWKKAGIGSPNPCFFREFTYLAYSLNVRMR